MAAAPVHAAGLQPGRINDTRADDVRAASDAQDVANMANYADRVVVLGPIQPASIPVDALAVPNVAPEPASLLVAYGDDKLAGLFLFGGLAALPLLLGGGGSSLGAGAFVPPIAGTPPGTPSGPGEVATPPDTVPPITSLPTSPVPGNPNGSDGPGNPSGPGEVPTPSLPVTPAIPEPATWAMLLLGFGAIGTAMRRGKIRRRRTGVLPAHAS